MLRVFSLVFAFLGSSSVFAGQALDFSIHQDYVSARALSMGNAFTAVVDDDATLFYNPAALARREDGEFRAYLGAGIDAEYMKFINDVKTASSKATESEKIDAMTALIEANYGNNYYSRLPTLGIQWMRPKWGIAFIPADLSIDIGIHQQVGPMVNVNAYLDSKLAFGYGWDVKKIGKDQRLSVGATLKVVNRVNVSESLIAAELASDSKVFDINDANEGMTVDADLGTLYTPSVPTSGFFKFLKYMKPTVAFVVRNVLDYGYNMNLHLIGDQTGVPPKSQRRYDLGTKWDLPDFWKFSPVLAVDMRDMGHTNWTPKKGFHLGAELGWKMFNWWKGTWGFGLNQGYVSMGVGARLAWFKANLASWGEEVGTSSVPKESRRYMLELSLDF